MTMMLENFGVQIACPADPTMEWMQFLLCQVSDHISLATKTVSTVIFWHD